MKLHSFLFIASGFCLASVSAGTPGKLLPRLEPHPHKARRTDVPKTLLIPATPGVPAGAVVSTSLDLKRSVRQQLQPRAVTCQDTGYSVCPNQTSCCPVEGTCCSSDSCCPNRFSCCSGGECCPDGYDCATVNGQNGCCPTGQTCSTGSGQCADADYVACPGENFCCPPGETCSSANGQPTCIQPSASISTNVVGLSTSSSNANTPTTTATSSQPPATSSTVTTPTPTISTSVVVVVPSSTSISALIPTTMSNSATLGFPTIVSNTLDQGFTTADVGIPTSGLNPAGPLGGAASPKVVLNTRTTMIVAAILVCAVQLLGFAL